MTRDADMPPREGLIPGTWKMIDPSRTGGIIDRPRMPSRWSTRHVGMRLIEAHRILKRLPMRLWPAEINSVWPEFEQEPDETAREQGGVKVDPTSKEIAFMEQAIAWPMRFIRDDPWMASDVNRWASQMKVEEFEKIADDDNKVPWAALRLIANGLTVAGEVAR